MYGNTYLTITAPLSYTDIMAKIPMFGKRGVGKFALVDDEDVELVAGVRWHVNGSGYAVNKDRSRTLRMHRVINNTPDGLFTDHKNHDTLDNRKANLRTVTQKENMNNLHNVKGYCWVTEKKLWKVTYKGKHYSYAKTEEEARELYKKARSGAPKASMAHPRRKHLPKGVLFMQPMAEKGHKPYYVRPRINGVSYFKGYFKTSQEAEEAYNNLLAEKRIAS